MLTLITGTPGAGKTLYAVSELARKVPGSTIEADGVAVPRRLLSNIKDLLVEHEHINADALQTWHEWAKPGDVILYDEVQEVWRPRALGKEVPPAIAALETHRHKGVDIVLVTQHPMLLDSNIRRLVNQHLHVRRIASGFSMVYEWDHCSNIPTFKPSLQSKVWRYPKDVFSLYKSAQLHTKPVTKIPRIAYLGIVAVIGLAFAGHYAYGRVTARFNEPDLVNAKPLPVARPGQHAPGQQTSEPGTQTPPGQMAEAPPAGAPVTVTYMGCIASATRCKCWDASGVLALLPQPICMEQIRSVGNLVAPNGGVSAPATPLPPAARSPDVSPEAAAPAMPSVVPFTGAVSANRPGSSVL